MNKLEKLVLSNIMTRLPYVAGPEENLIQVRKQMEAHNVRHLPVRDGNDIIGIISERDIALALSLVNAVDGEVEVSARDVCTPDPYCVDVSERFDVVLQYMAKQRIGSAIVTENSEMIGIITTTDISRVCGFFIQELFDEAS